MGWKYFTINNLDENFPFKFGNHIKIMEFGIKNCFGSGNFFGNENYSMKWGKLIFWGAFSPVYLYLNETHKETLLPSSQVI